MYFYVLFQNKQQSYVKHYQQYFARSNKRAFEGRDSYSRWAMDRKKRAEDRRSKPKDRKTL